MLMSNIVLFIGFQTINFKQRNKNYELQNYR
jgi:hypothetical protein